MKYILHSESGVTVLEGVIALGLLALVAAGAFGVLLSASRQDSMPDIREEMSYAVEKANDKLKVYLQASPIGDVGRNYLPESLSQGLCYAEGITDGDPLETGKAHNISCLLPPVCDKSNNSGFSYTVSGRGAETGHVVTTRREGTPETYGTRAYGDGYGMSSVGSGYTITFTIRCNGYEL